jgi:hypothetical protein
MLYRIEDALSPADATDAVPDSAGKAGCEARPILLSVADKAHQ